MQQDVQVTMIIITVFNSYSLAEAHCHSSYVATLGPGHEASFQKIGEQTGRIGVAVRPRYKEVPLGHTGKGRNSGLSSVTF